MPLSVRVGFAVGLWLIAAVPWALLAIHELASPPAAVVLAVGARQVLVWTALATAGGGLLALLLWPSFLPGMRLGLGTLRRRIATDPGPLREAIGRLRHAETAADHLQAGRFLVQQRRSREALPHLVRAVELDPEHLASRYQLGLALAQLGDLAHAAEQLARVVKLDEAHAFGQALLDLGELLERSGADQQAALVLERHTQRFGFNPKASLHQGRALARLGQTAAAVEALRAAAQPRQPGQARSAAADLVRAQARMALLRMGKLR